MTWCKLQRLTATTVADRAGISRTTLRSIETNPVGATFASVIAVLAVLGLDEEVATSVDPTRSIRSAAHVSGRGVSIGEAVLVAAGCP